MQDMNDQQNFKDMTMTTMTMNTASTTSQTSFLGRLLAAWEQHKIVQRTYRELDALSDRELNDIGLSRCDIRRVAMGENVRYSN